ncbi:MAG: bifunctional phosphoribosylaminoimidazolecarboxamide formyltransferase/IMP cyclohydrolase [Halofilum sp. (in: g-proteobacteria)]|nr:bifunctional phosphoribosylaminoimidazolecarboxamide formyltransferase/IMP cyclohydrolase [Halofilum sp. (in: g-proteobacteria)]
MRANATPVRRALLSVSDKTGLADFARALAAQDVELLSTGGTARALRDAGLAVTEVADHTGAPEIMGGRVKTLHPRIHGGILGRRDVDAEVMEQYHIAPIDLVVVNLYPFRETVAREDVTREQAIEQIDIGGPAMVRAAAKNQQHVAVVTDPADYDTVGAEIAKGGTSEHTRRHLALKAFRHTAAYDAAIADWLGCEESDADSLLPTVFQPRFERMQELRYGENPHQRAAFYAMPDGPAATVTRARVLQGKALSFNNIADADTALECVKQFDEPACVIVKHANPCGVAVAADPAAAYEGAYATDPVSAFGGIIAFNRPLDAGLARTLVDRQFIEVLIAPAVGEDALAVLAEKKNLRVLATGELAGMAGGLDFRGVAGGLLVQERDVPLTDDNGLRSATRIEPDDRMIRDLLFAWRVSKSVKSNAIVYAADGRTIGIGAGQMSRVISTRICAIKAADAGLDTRGAVMASDAFIPFRDVLDAAAGDGIAAVIQPGGSMHDDEVIAAADELGLVMVFTGMRHFRH